MTHRIDDMPLSDHFYYVKPASGFELWPEMGAMRVQMSPSLRTQWIFADLKLLLTTDTLQPGVYDENHSTFVGEGTADAIKSLSGAASL